MTRTTLQNTTNGPIVLHESQAGIVRKLCEVNANEPYVVRSQLNQTYKEYLCVSKNSNQFTLSSDDLSDWKEIVIKADASDAEKLVWEGRLRTRDRSAAPAPPAHRSARKRQANWVVGCFRASSSRRGPSAPAASSRVPPPPSRVPPLPSSVPPPPSSVSPPPSGVPPPPSSVPPPLSSVPPPPTVSMTGLEC